MELLLRGKGYEKYHAYRLNGNTSLVKWLHKIPLKGYDGVTVWRWFRVLYHIKWFSTIHFPSSARYNDEPQIRLFIIPKLEFKTLYYKTYTSCFFQTLS
jgi:hypothetical protein